MKPFTHTERQAIIDSHPASAPSEIEADIDEYQSLVAELMSSDPSVPVVAAAPAAMVATASIGQSDLDLESDLTARLQLLQAKLFP